MGSDEIGANGAGAPGDGWREAAQRALGDLTGGPVRPYSTYDFGRRRDGRCLSVILPDRQRGALLTALRDRLPAGAVAFLGTSRWLGDERHAGIELVVGPGASQFDILRLARTDGVNYGLDTTAIVAKLREYDDACGITITHAETDTVEFDLARTPADLAAFATDLYDLCPDAVEQGVGNVADLAASIAIDGSIFLWWD